MLNARCGSYCCPKLLSIEHFPFAIRNGISYCEWGRSSPQFFAASRKSLAEPVIITDQSTNVAVAPEDRSATNRVQVPSGSRPAKESNPFERGDCSDQKSGSQSRSSGLKVPTTVPSKISVRDLACGPREALWPGAVNNRNRAWHRYPAWQ